jgi:hypothetical protein
MLMKRHYDNAGKCTHVTVKHTGSSQAQNFSHRIVEDGVADGWIAVGALHLVIKTDGEPLRYDLKRTPGYYCSSTGERIPVSAMAWASPRRGDLASREARDWLAKAGKAPTDYEVTNAYECTLDPEQHDQFRAVLDAKGRVVGKHTLEG